MLVHIMLLLAILNVLDQQYNEGDQANKCDDNKSNEVGFENFFIRDKKARNKTDDGYDNCENQRRQGELIK